MKLSILASLALAVTLAVTAAAQVPPALERGFRPESVYDLNGFDTVNTSNGNLIASIPLGVTYPVGEGLSYGFTLRYSGNVWQRMEVTETVFPQGYPRTGARYLARKEDNAGLGWRLSFGEFYGGQPVPPAQDDPAVLVKGRYVSPDGSEHLLWQTLHEPRCVGGITTNCDPVANGVFYTRDNSYLRVSTPSLGTQLVAFPDGQLHLFELAPSGLYRLKWMYHTTSTTNAAGEPTSNFVRFTYTSDTSGEVVTITDSHARTHRIRKDTTGRVTKVEVMATNARTAIYEPVYAQETLFYPCEDALRPEATHTQNLLMGLNLPTGETWGFQYEIPTACDDKSGTLTAATLPTKGRIEWAYDPMVFNDFTNGAAVQTRTMVTGGIKIGRKVYSVSYFTPMSARLVIEEQTNVNPSGTPVWRAVAQTHQWTSREEDSSYLLPFTKATPYPGIANPDGSYPPRYLSTATFTCDPATGACPATPERVTFVAHEMDQRADVGCLPQEPCYFDLNRRVVASRTLYVDDGSRYADVNHSRFDGLGHYRQTDTSGNFDSGNFRTTSTEYNATMGTYSVSNGTRQPGYGYVASTAPWLVNTYTETSVSESGVTEKRQYCFSSQGLLLRQRTLAGAAPAANDLLTVWTRATGTGHIVQESIYGGDTQSLGTTAICSLALPTEQRRIRYTWSYGTLATARYDNVTTGQPLAFYSTNNVVDQSTGLVARAHDVSGLGTAYTYDLAGRLTGSAPDAGGLGKDDFIYTAATATTPAQVEAVEWNVGGTVAMGRSLWLFDAFGRVSHEKKLLADGTWGVREHVYDGAGNKTFVSEIEAAAEPVNGTTYGNFDAFGRARSITLPDGSVTSIAYSGDRIRQQTTWYRSAGAAGAPVNAQAVTTQTFDRQGRLWQVSEPSGTSGTATATTYGYDGAGRLRSVSSGSQARTFTYDGRGLLLRESHPENSTFVAAAKYNAAGQIVEKPDARSGSLRFTYDAAGRPLTVSDRALRPLKQYTYATANIPGTPYPDRRLGRLLEAVRHNYFDIYGQDITIKETYYYGGIGGLVSQRNTQSSDGTIFMMHTLKYDDRGRRISMVYPSCFGACTYQGPTVTNVYMNGFLTQVPGYANSITYHPNGLVAQVNYANGASWRQTNDPNSMPRPRKIETLGTTANWTTGLYSYDGSGNITEMGSDVHWYDGVGRLTRGTVLSGAAAQEFTYDGFGNMTSVRTTTGGASTVKNIAVSSTTNRLTTETYDAAGNQVTGSGLRFDYDDLNMVRQVYTDDYATNWAYIYTPDDERIWSYDLGANISYWRVRDLDNRVLVQLVNNNGDWNTDTTTVYRGGTLLASVSPQRNPARNFYAVDHLGTPRQVLGESGAVIANETYYPFGQPVSGSNVVNDALKFTGHERDLVNGDYYMHARYYSATLGRFLSVDPVLDVKANLPNPQRWNRYSYVSNNPIKKIDPDGRDELLLMEQLQQEQLAVADGTMSRVEYSEAVRGRALGAALGAMTSAPFLARGLMALYRAATFSPAVETTGLTLTLSQAKNISKVNELVHNWDVRRTLQVTGEQLVRHEKKLREGIANLQRVESSLSASLQNRKLDPATTAAIQQAVEYARKYREAAEELLKDLK